MSRREPRQPRPRRVRMRRARGATESLLSIVLALEAFVVFFIILVVYSLRLAPPAVAFSAGAALLVLLLVASRGARRPWGWWLGWVLQALLIATGIVVSLMYVIGIGFAALYAYCFITGRRLDKRNGFVDSPPPSIDPGPNESENPA